MERFKRIIVVLVSAALLVGGLAIPAFAHQVEAVNLLDTVTFTVDGEDQYTSQKYLSAGSHIYHWTPLTSVFSGSVALTVISHVRPTNVVLNGCAPYSEHYFDGGYYQFYFNLSDVFLAASGIEFLDFSFTLESDTDFSIVSCMGFADNIDGISKVNMKVDNTFFDTYGNLKSQEQVFNDYSIPQIFSYNFIPDDSQWQFNKAYIEITIPNSTLAAEYLDYMFLSFISTDVATVTAFLRPPGSNSADYVETVYSSAAPTGGHMILGDHWHNTYYNLYKFDLSGLNLNNRDLVISVALDGIFSGPIESDAEGYYFELQQIYRGLPQEEKPWYRVFADWLSGQFDRLVDALGGNSSGMEQITDDMQQAAGSLDQAGEALDSVAKPDTGDITGAVDNVLAGVDIEQYGGMLGGFFDSAALSGMMITVAVLALCSYALFGKKG